MSITNTTWPYRYWEDTPGGEERLNAARKLRFRPTENREWYSAEDTLKEDWQIMFDKFLLDLGMWTSEEEKSPEDYFNKKSMIYFSLLEDIAPRGRAWNAVLKDYILFLRQNELRGKSRLQWYWYVRWLTGIAKRLKEPERSKLSDAMKNSGNAAIKLQFDLLEFEPKP